MEIIRMAKSGNEGYLTRRTIAISGLTKTQRNISLAKVSIDPHIVMLNAWHVLKPT